MLLSSPSIAITVEHQQLFVHPSLDVSETPNDDVFLRGTVLLSLPSRKSVKRVKVVLEGACDLIVQDNHPHERIITLHKDLEDDLDGQVLDAGKHAFNFEFSIPASAAVHQRGPYAQIRHYVIASAEFASTFSAKIASPPIAVWISASPLRPNEPPEPHNIHDVHHDDNLGPVDINVSSPHLTVGGLMCYSLSFHPPSPITIISITPFIAAQFELHYSSSIVQTPSKLHPLRILDDSAASPHPWPPSTTSGQYKDLLRPADAEPLCHLPVGQEWKYTRLARLPNDSVIRPTTLPGTVTQSRASHFAVVQIVYEINDTRKTFAIRLPLSLTSCCALNNNDFLPVYSAIQPHTVLQPDALRCQCAMSLEEMCARDGQFLERAASIDEPTTMTAEARTLGLGGRREEKSPALGLGGG